MSAPDILVCDLAAASAFVLIWFSRAVRALVMAFFLEAVASLLSADAYARKYSVLVVYSLPVHGPVLWACVNVVIAKNTTNKLMNL